MNKLDQMLNGTDLPPVPVAADCRRLTSVQRRSILKITAIAVALYVTVRLLPTGTNLSHMDFRVEGKGALEFCDPANPQFIPVVQVRSPIVLGLEGDRPPAVGQPVNFVLTMHTASGKPIAPEDLLVAHTKKLHLMVIDPTITDYQHIHPEPGRHPGEWNFSVTPARAGLYRVFADFTPVATGRSLYGVAEFTVPGAVAEVVRSNNTTYDAGDLHFELEITQPIRARKPLDLRFHVTRGKGEPIQLQPVMGAYAHLVAFDEARSGFAHLHPSQIDTSQPLDPTHPELDFKITIPQAGRYVVWSQIRVEGQQIFAPFWMDVLP
jgi:hypothetical protein